VAGGFSSRPVSDSRLCDVTGGAELGTSRASSPTCGPVLYLDFDGVLHHENVLWHPFRGPHLVAPTGHRLFQHVDLLVEMLAPHPGIDIVLSTAWTLRYGCRGAARRLPLSLRHRVVGATFHSNMDRDQFLSASRGMQVWSDVKRRHPSDWLALDDDAFGWPAWCRDRLLRTHSELGIGPLDVQEQVRGGLARISLEPFRSDTRRKNET